MPGKLHIFSKRLRIILVSPKIAGGRYIALLLATVAALSFAACGKKGPLYLPDHSPATVAPSGSVSGPATRTERR
jgi:predicted small lipoprotein YifL